MLACPVDSLTRDMIRVFRASEVGKCAFALAYPHLIDSSGPDPLKEQFLKDSTWLQESVLDFLEEYGDVVLQYREPVVDYEPNVSMKELDIWKSGDWKLIGHPDGITLGGAIVEVKCVSSKVYERLKKESWKDIWPRYLYQAVAYSLWSEIVYMVFKNRDTGEMTGGFDITHPAYTYDDSMEVIVQEESVMVERIIQKLDKVVSKPEKIGECTAEGYCFDCGKFTGMAAPQHRISLERAKLDSKNKTAVDLIDSGLQTYRVALSMLKEGISLIRPLFRKHKATELEIVFSEGEGTLVIPNPGRRAIRNLLPEWGKE